MRSAMQWLALTMLLSPAAQAEEITLNTASAGELVSTAQLDAGTAEQIVALRQIRGRLNSVEELRILNGISSSDLDRLRSTVPVDLAVSTSTRHYRTVEEVLSQFKDEPEILEVQALALAYTKTHPELVDRWLHASKNAAWLPELTAEYHYDNDVGYDYEYATDAEGASYSTLTDADEDWDKTYKVRFKWKLDELVMSSERIRIINEAQDIVKLRDKVLEEITRIYFDRRRLQVEMLLAPPQKLRKKVDNELRLMEYTANMDAYTGGGFSASLAGN